MSVSPRDDKSIKHLKLTQELSNTNGQQFVGFSNTQLNQVTALESLLLNLEDNYYPRNAVQCNSVSPLSSGAMESPHMYEGTLEELLKKTFTSNPNGLVKQNSVVNSQETDLLSLDPDLENAVDITQLLAATSGATQLIPEGNFENLEQIIFSDGDRQLQTLGQESSIPAVVTATQSVSATDTINSVINSFDNNIQTFSMAGMVPSSSSNSTWSSAGTSSISTSTSAWNPPSTVKIEDMDMLSDYHNQATNDSMTSSSSLSPLTPPTTPSPASPNMVDSNNPYNIPRGKPGRKPSANGPSRNSRKRQVEKGTEEYRDKRIRNNIAVRKSRDKAKQKQMETEGRVSELVSENEGLHKKVELLTKELNVLKSLFLNVGAALPDNFEKIVENILTSK